ncbi:Bug family tripartite tricarboxylate transporter substrate binding protein [Achromobacter aloeverae]
MFLASRMPRFAALLSLSAVAFFASPAPAQELPRNKPITILVGFAAGGALDLTARVVADQLAKNLGQSVMVENRPGAGGNIAQDYVAGATPDGSTIFLGSIGSLTINPHLMKLAHDPLKDLQPLTMGVDFPNVLVVGSQLGVKTLKDYIALSKRKELDFASSGIGSASHMAGEMFNQRAGINNVHVPYKGGSQAIVDLLAGRVAAYYATPSTALPYIKSGQLVALATTGLARTELLPDVPTVAESGFPGFDATNWYAFVAPGKTPVPVLDQLNREIVKVLKTPEVQAKLTQQGLTPMPQARQQLGEFMAKESASWSQIIKERHITLN